MQRRLGPSYYDILGVAPSAEPEVIDQAFRSRVREVRDQPGGGDLTRQLNLAYRALKDPERRASYDAALAGSPLPPRADQPRPRSAFFAPGPSFPVPPRERADEPLVDSDEQPGVPGQSADKDTPAEPQQDAAPVEASNESAPSEPEQQTVPVQAAEEAPPPGPDPSEPLSVSAASEPIAEERVPQPANLDEPLPINRDESFYEEPVTEDADDGSYQRRPSHMKRAAAFAALACLAVPGAIFLVGPGKIREGTVRTASRAPLPSLPPTASKVRPASNGAVEVASPASEATPPEKLSEPERGRTEKPIVGRSERKPGNQLDRAVSLALRQSAGRSQEEEQPSGSEQDDRSTSNAAADEPDRQADVQPPPVASRAPAPRVSRAMPARHIGGGLVNSDNPGGRFVGSVAVRFTVLPNGRTTRCRVTRSSGNSALDARTCGLLQQRLQFAPALDEDGKPIPVDVSSSYTWGRTRRPTP